MNAPRLAISAGQPFDGGVIDAAQLFNVFQFDIFVRLMDGGRLAGKLRAEPRAVFQCPRVSAAADGDGRRLFARFRPIHFEQGTDELAVFVAEQGSLTVQKPVFYARPVEYGSDAFLPHGGGVAYVGQNVKGAVPVFGNIRRHREPPRFVRVIFQTERIGEKYFVRALDILALRGEKREKFAQRVFALFGSGRVRGDAARGKRAVFEGKPGFFAAFRAWNALCLGVGADHIRALAAAQFCKGRVLHGKCRLEVQNTLFRIDDGKIRVGGKARIRHVRAFFVVLDARPAALFVAAEDEFDLFTGRKTFVFERFQTVQADRGGAFVVHSAPPVQFALPDLPAEGRMRPPAACGHHVKVAQHGDLFPFAEYDFARKIIVIVRFKAHGLRVGKECVQTVRRAFAEGHARFGRRLRAVVRDERFKKRYDVVLIIFHAKHPVFTQNIAKFLRAEQRNAANIVYTFSEIW